MINSTFTASSIAVIGFGLIGGSVALAARSRGLVQRIVAIDRRDILGLEAALELADAVCDSQDRAAVRAAVAEADVTVLATPVGVIESLIIDVLAAANVLTDCGSTKRKIVAAAETCSRRGRFVAGHPMAGRPAGGIAHADGDLFVDRSWILCPAGSDPDALAIVRSLVNALGARVMEMTAGEHDRSVALTSHVPQLLASVLATLAEERDAWPAAGPAFMSATRVAGGEQAMWHDILATNSDEIASALQTVADRLIGVAEGLRQGPPELSAALELLGRARSLRRR